MDLKTLETDQAIEAVAAMDNLEELREAARSIDVKFSGNSGLNSLKAKILAALEKTEEADVEQDEEDEDPDLMMVAKPKKKITGLSDHDLMKMDANKIEDPQLRRQVVRAKALRLRRVKITSLDPADAQLSAAIITVNNKYTGKVSRAVPFADEAHPNGYHIEQILLDHMLQMKFALRREKKGNRFGVKQYSTTMSPKYSIEFLPDLTRAEIQDLAALQRASGSIDAA